MDYSTMKTAVKEHCGIASANTTYDTQIDRWINDAQADFVSESNWKYIEARASLSTSTYKFQYQLRADVDVLKAVTYQKKYRLKPVKNHDDWIRLLQSKSTGTPRWYYSHAGTLKIYPKPDSSSQTTTLANGVTGTTDSLKLTAITPFEHAGRVKVEDEIIEYQNVDSTNVKLANCIRGVEGTTSTIHTSGKVTTYRDLEYDYYKVLADLSATTDSSYIPLRYHRALPLYASAQFMYSQEDPVNGDKFLERYMILREQAKRDLGQKQTQEFSSTLDDDQTSRDVWDNTNPERGSLSQL